MKVFTATGTTVSDGSKKSSTGLRPATLLKKRLWQRCLPVNFAKFLRTPFLQSTSGRLLLEKLKIQVRRTSH